MSLSRRATNVQGALLAALLFLNAWTCGQASPASTRPLRSEISAFIEEMVQKHQYDRALLQRVFGQAQPRPSILSAMSAPATARPWHVFRGRYIDELRISAGARFWRENAEVLAQASREFRVPEEIIVATIGVETMYGRDMGSFRVLDALTTLAFDYPPRAEFFRGELEQFLLLVRETGFNPAGVRGSYAGAIGIPQFLPSSYRKYAVDYDRNGTADLVRTPADAIGSVANYYRAFGWEEGATITVRAEAAEIAVDAVLAAGIKPHARVGELKKRGIVPQAPVPDEAEAALFALETEAGTEYWLGLQNFYVITRYNRSVNYAMVVYELSRELRRAFQREAGSARGNATR